MGAQMMVHLLSTLNQKPQIAAQLVAAGAHNHPALGHTAGQVAAPEPENDDNAADRDQILLDALSAVKKNQAKKEMSLLIKDGVKHDLWRRTKIIKNPAVRR